MLKGIPGLLVVFLLATGVVRPAPAAEEQALYEKGRNAIFEERWPEAKRLFEDLKRRYPEGSFADDAHYWLGMALYELGDPEGAYGVLKQMSTLYPDSPWNDDSRALMVRCAESALRPAPGREAGGAGGSGGIFERAQKEYESFLDRATRDTSTKVQLLAIDTVLGSNPGKAPELLPRLSAGKSSREAAGLVLDRFFDGDDVKVTLENPSLGLRDGNVAIMVRQSDRISYLTLSEATDLIRSANPPAGRFDRAVVSAIRDKLLQAERNLVREGDPGTVETLSGLGAKSKSAIVRVVDGEVHYYRNGDETVRILVLRRQAGFTDANVKVFTESRGGVRELTMGEVRRLSASATGAAADSGALSDATLRYLKAALAIIEIDLTRASASPSE
ncbi:MAG TPA: tetratricopeptide repeat protein [Candidatus Polarisedimenticolia bacterium]